MPNQQLDSIWTAVRAELRRDTPEFKFRTWLDPLELAGISDRTLFVRAPEQIRTSVGERYLPLLRTAARRAFDERAVVELVGADWTPEAVQTPATPARVVDSDRLNPRYTFDQFVIGEGNRFAHAAALAVAELPAQAYNPLFLHGPPGLGKTHLLHAIGDYVRRYGSGLQVRYATSEDFTTAFVDAVRDRRTAEFKERFRSADVLLVDDIQFLANKAKTREEFFHTFNALLESGRQIVMTADRAPEELQDLEARLVERFRSGLVVELDGPVLCEREAILRSRARLDGVDIADDALGELARLVTTSVRALEGALIRVVAYSSLKNERPTAGLVRHVLDRLGESVTPATPDPQAIFAGAAEEFGVELTAVLGRTRRSDVSLARQVGMFVAREELGMDWADISRVLGRDRATIYHGVNRIRGVLDTDPAVRKAVDNLCRQFGRSS